MTNYEVIRRLIGDIRPVGDADVDPQKLENLKAMCELMDEIHTAIDAVAYDFRNDKRGSVVKVCDYANKFLDKLGISDEKEGSGLLLKEAYDFIHSGANTHPNKTRVELEEKIEGFLNLNK